jgi:soluble lytic murein transglycosylase-like protein
MNLVLILARFAIVLTLLGDASAGVKDTSQGTERALPSPSAPFLQRSNEDLQRVAETLPGTIPNEIDPGSNALRNPSESLRQSITPDLVTPRNSKSPNVVSAESICLMLAKTALDNDLPIDFFTRLIWQESHFNSNAISYAGAQGIAQFMPATAVNRGLADQFDPLTALQAAGRFLKHLRIQFGNLGLAAAPHTMLVRAGSKRGSDVVCRCLAKLASTCGL